MSEPHFPDELNCELIQDTTNYSIAHCNDDVTYPYIWTSHKWMMRGATKTLIEAINTVMDLESHRYVSLREIYESPVISVTSEISVSFLTYFVPELNLVDYELEQDTERLVFQKHNKYITSVWLDGNPVMLCFEASNERKKIITSELFYRDMLGYLLSLRRFDVMEISHIDELNWYASMINDEFVDTMI